MKKKFTYNVPDEMWVDNFSKNLTANATYEGSNTIYVLVSGSSVISWSLEDYEFYNKDSSKVINLDATAYPNVAYFLTTVRPEIEYEDLTNPDGTIYQIIKNPMLHDYYVLTYDDSVEGESPWKFLLITRSRYVPDESRVKIDLEVAENHKQNFTFDANVTKILDKYISDAKDYLESLKQYYPWRYVEFNPPKGPDMPLELQEAFKNVITEQG